MLLRIIVDMAPLPTTPGYADALALKLSLDWNFSKCEKVSGIALIIPFKRLLRNFLFNLTSISQ